MAPRCECWNRSRPHNFLDNNWESCIFKEVRKDCCGGGIGLFGLFIINMSVSLEALKTLRDLSGAGMSDCKKALEQCGNDIDSAMKYLREKGIASASKKADREMKEGICGFMISGGKATAIKLACETDFVVKNDKFRVLSSEILKALGGNNAENLEDAKNVKLASDVVISDEIAATIGIIGENIALTQYKQISGEILCSYVHTSMGEGFGRIATCLAIKSNGNAEKITQIGNQICMHIAAANPTFLKTEDVSEEFIRSEKEIYTKQMEGSGKPANIIEKIVEGKLTKTYQDCVLLEQPFVIDPTLKVKEFITKIAKELGCDIEITDFIRVAVA